MPTLIAQRSKRIQAHRKSGVLTVTTYYDALGALRCDRCGNPSQRFTVITFRDGSQIRLGPECVSRFMTGSATDSEAWHDLQRRVLDMTAIRKALDLPPNEMPGWNHTRIRDSRNPVRELRSPITDSRVKWGPEQKYLEIPLLRNDPTVDKWSKRKQERFLQTATADLERAKEWFNDEIARTEVQLSKLLWQNWPKAK